MGRWVSALAAEWIEITGWKINHPLPPVSALAAEWIELIFSNDVVIWIFVSALAAEWIEILLAPSASSHGHGLRPRGGVD